MCEVHTARPSELEALSTLIARVNSSLDVGRVLEHAMEVCAELTGCEGALVYLWDEEQQRLVVRGAVEGYRHWVGAFGLELGEGLTGWTALTRRPGIIAEDALADPRFKLVPELNDSRFQSVLTVPIVGREDRLVGVITLHTVAPHEFSEDDVRTAETVASLVAGAVENATLHERVLRSMKVFRSLAEASRQLTVAAHAPQTLQRLALTALELLDATLVVVLRYEERTARLVVETWVGGAGGGVPVDSLPADGRWLRLLGGGPASVALDGDDPIANRLGGRLELRSLFAAPLSFAGRPAGLLCCYSPERRSLAEDNLALLGTIANHAAVVLEEGRSAEPDRGSLVRDLFDELRAGGMPSGRAAELGIGLAEPHAVVVVEAGDGGVLPPAARVREALRRVFPGSVVDGGRPLCALVPVRSEQWAVLLEDTLASVLAGTGAVAGFSDSTAGSSDYALAFRQARMAAAVAHTARGRPVRAYAGLGAQRYLWAISQERDPDPLELAVSRLRDLDRTRGSDLFRTLEAYLEHQGNAGRTAVALYVHRNTLRQRLRRIRDLIGVDPADPAAWFELQLAVRLIRFRESAP